MSVASDESVAPPAKPAFGDAWRERLPGRRLVWLRALLVLAALALVGDNLLPLIDRPADAETSATVGWPFRLSRGVVAIPPDAFVAIAVDAWLGFAIWCAIAACVVCALSQGEVAYAHRVASGLLAWHGLWMAWAMPFWRRAPSGAFSLEMYYGDQRFYLLMQGIALAAWPVVLLGVLPDSRGGPRPFQFGLRSTLLMMAFAAVAITVLRLGDVALMIEQVRPLRLLGGPVSSSLLAAFAVFWITTTLARTAGLNTPDDLLVGAIPGGAAALLFFAIRDEAPRRISFNGDFALIVQHAAAIAALWIGAATMWPRRKSESDASGAPDGRVSRPEDSRA